MQIPIDNSKLDFIGATEKMDNLFGRKLANLTLFSETNQALGYTNINSRVWRGYTTNDEFVYIYCHNGVVSIGLDEREINAEKETKKIGMFKEFIGLTVEKILTTVGITYDWNNHYEF